MLKRILRPDETWCYSDSCKNHQFDQVGKTCKSYLWRENFNEYPILYGYIDKPSRLLTFQIDICIYQICVGVKKKASI